MFRVRPSISARYAPRAAGLASWLLVGGCGHDWDTYDPRAYEGASASSSSSSSVSSSSAGGAGGAGGSSSSGSGGAQGGSGGAEGGSGGGGSGPGGYPATVFADRPAGYWRLGEAVGATNAQDELGAHEGLFVGSVGLGVPGILASDPNTAAYFDGGTTSVQIGDAFDFAGTEPFTIEAWINPDYLGGSERRIVTKEDLLDPAGQQGYHLYARMAAPSIGFERWVDGAADGAVYSMTPLTLLVYSHVVVTYDGAELVLYVNGAVLDTQPAALPLADHAASFAWGGTSDPSETSFHISANLDEVAVYDHALTEDRVIVHYQAGAGP